MTIIIKKLADPEICMNDCPGLAAHVTKSSFGKLVGLFLFGLTSGFVQRRRESDLDSLSEHMLDDIGQSGRRPGRNPARSVRQPNLLLHMPQ